MMKKKWKILITLIVVFLFALAATCSFSFSFFLLPPRVRAEILTHYYPSSYGMQSCSSLARGKNSIFDL